MRKENILLIDGRRDKKMDLLTSFLPNIDGFDLIKIDELLELRSISGEELKKIKAVVHQGGDGSLGFLLNFLYDLNFFLPIIYLGGGTACTTLRGLINYPKPEPVPEDLKDLVSEGNLINYSPLKITSESSNDDYTASYLAGFGHLTIGVTQIFEKIRRGVKNPSLAYILAGLISLFNLNQKVKSSAVISQENKEEFSLNDERLGALEILTIPYLATFALNQPYPFNDKMYLLLIEGETQEIIFLRYGMTLIVGGLFLHGVNWLINQGIVHLQQINKVSVLPDQDKTNNTCIDGELKHLSGRVWLSREEQKIPIIIPKSVSTFYYR